MHLSLLLTYYFLCVAKYTNIISMPQLYLFQTNYVCSVLVPLFILTNLEVSKYSVVYVWNGITQSVLASAKERRSFLAPFVEIVQVLILLR